MMQWKSRQWVYRDEFGDILRGMRMAEELHDIIEMEPSSTGGYAAPVVQPEPDAPDDRPDFDALLPPDVDRDHVEMYAGKCAAHFKQGMEEFKASIVQNGQMEDFLKAFTQWAAKQAGQSMPQKENAPQRQAHEADAPDQAFRSEFINLKGPGFSTWVFKNRDRLAQAPTEIQTEAREKWAKLYPQTRWPLDPQEAHAEETAPMFPQEAPGTVDMETGEILTVACPEQDGKNVDIDKCEACKMREGCPSWSTENEQS
jgi:hypothetical protein